MDSFYIALKCPARSNLIIVTLVNVENIWNVPTGLCTHNFGTMDGYLHVPVTFLLVKQPQLFVVQEVQWVQ